MRKLLILLFLLLVALSVQAQTATVTWGTTHQTIDGFGASDEAHRASMSTANQSFFFGTGPGQLGLSILRVGVTDGSQDPGDCTSVGTNCAGDYVSDMQAVIANGGKVYAAPWSPPAAYKTNGSTICTAGSGSGALSTGSYSAYATWMANFVQSLQTYYSIPLAGISIQNEPTNCTSYDSAIWTAAQIDTFVKTNLGPTFASAGLSTPIFIPETDSYTTLTGGNGGTTCMEDSSCSAYVGGVSWHDGDSTLTPNSTPYPSGWKSVQHYWMTEISCTNGFPTWCPSGFNTGITEALDWAILIHDRLANENANAWFYWQMIDYGSGGTTQDDSLMSNTGIVAQRAYVLGQWAHFVRPGWVRIDATANPQAGVYVSAFKETASGKFAIVAVNQNSASVNVNFSLSGFPAVTAVIPTLTSASANLVDQASANVSSDAFAYSLPATSIVTFHGTASDATTGPTPPTNLASTVH